MWLFACLMALSSGAARTFSRMVNAQLSERVGPVQSTLSNYLVGLLVSLLVLSVSRPPLHQVASLPWWAYSGGLIGVAFVLLLNITTPRLSAFTMTMLLFVGQIAMSIALDAWSAHHLGWSKPLGGLLILLGLAWNLRIDRTTPRPEAN